MIQERIKFLIKESRPIKFPYEEWRIIRKKIEELDWVLALFK